MDVSIEAHHFPECSSIWRTDDAHALLDRRGSCHPVPRVGTADGDGAAATATTTTAARAPQGVQASSGQAAPAGGRPELCNLPPAANRDRREEGPRCAHRYLGAELLLDSGRQGCRREGQARDRNSL